MTLPSSNQLELMCACDCGGAARDTELPIDIRDMALRCVARDEELAPDISQGQIALEHAEDLKFPICQDVGLGLASVDAIGRGSECHVNLGEALFENASVAKGFESRASRSGVDACGAVVAEKEVCLGRDEVDLEGVEGDGIGESLLDRS